MKGQSADESKQMPKHPKNSKLGNKNVWYGTKILIDMADALTIKENDTVTFMVRFLSVLIIFWGNLS